MRRPSLFVGAAVCTVAILLALLFFFKPGANPFRTDTQAKATTSSGSRATHLRTKEDIRPSEQAATQQAYASIAKDLLRRAAKNLDYTRGVTMELEQPGGRGQKIQMKQVNGVLCSRLEMEIAGLPGVLLQNADGLWLVLEDTALKADFAYGAIGANVKQLTQGLSPKIDEESAYVIRDSWSATGTKLAHVTEEFPSQKVAEMVAAFMQGQTGTEEERQRFAQNNIPASVAYEIDPSSETIQSERRFNVNGQPVGPRKVFRPPPPEGIPDAAFFPEPSLKKQKLQSIADFKEFLRQHSRAKTQR